MAVKKTKTAIVLIIALCLVVFFAFLPGLTAKIIDVSQKNQAGSSEINPVSLDLSPEDGQLSIVEKMFLLKDGYAYPIGENGAKSTASEALGWVESIFAEYADAPNILGFEMPYYTVTPILYIDEKDPEMHAVFWGIYIVNEGASAQNLTVIADDETGTILGVQYNSAGMEIYNDAIYAEALNTLYQLWLEQLNATVVDHAEIEPSQEPTGEENWERSYITRYVSLRDEENREVVVEFTMDYDGSFYTNYVN